MTDVVIGILTYKRPRMLERALRALERLRTDICVSVLVADNDAADGEGRAVVQKLVTAGYRFPLSVVTVEERGISQARNAVVAAAFSDERTDFLVFMDDDQWPEPDWLDALVEMQRKTGAEVVRSAVLPAFEVEPPNWVRTCRVYARDTSSNGLVDMVYGTGGVLLAKALAARFPQPWFDPKFAMTGGEDSEFFQRLRASGVQFACASRSIIHESYPADRVGLRWALLRAYRTGCSDMLIALKQRPLSKTLPEHSYKIAGVFASAPFALVLASGSPGKQVDVLCRMARACGKIAALIGLRYNEYATTDRN